MKGMMRRHGGMKTKTIHGVSSKHHDNPHVLKRATGGRCAEAGGAVSAPSLSRPARRMGGKVGFKDQGSNNQGQMPKASSMPDTKRVEMGMDGKEKNRASGGMVPGKMAGKAATGGMKLKSPGSQSGSAKMAEKGMSSKSKDDGLEGGLNKKDGTKNASGKAFAGGGHVEKDKDDEEDDDDDSSDDAADEDEALDKIEHEAEEHHASGGRVGRKHGGRAHDDGLYDDRHHDDEYAKGGKVKFNPGGSKGKLHRELGISEDKKIPAKRLAKAEHSKNPEVAGDAKRAETMKHWKH